MFYNLETWSNLKWYQQLPLTWKEMPMLTYVVGLEILVLTLFPQKLLKKHQIRPKLKICLFHLTLPTKMHTYPNNFITILSCHLFLVWVAKANPMQTDVKVFHNFSGARGEKDCATIYQMTPWIWWHYSYIKNCEMMIYRPESGPKKQHPPTYPNFSDRAGSGETEIFVILA